MAGVESRQPRCGREVESFEPFNVTLTKETYQGKDAIAVVQTEQRDNDEQYSFARLKNFDFHNCTIEVTLAGHPRKDAFVLSFV